MRGGDEGENREEEEERGGEMVKIREEGNK